MTGKRKRRSAKRHEAIIEGNVRELRARSEISSYGSPSYSYGGSGSYAPGSYGVTSEEIWTFLLDAVDRNGHPLRPVPVEMRGRTFEGFVSEGDYVQARGTWKHGVFIADEVYDVATRSLVRAKQLSLAAKVVIGIVAGVIIVGFIGLMSYIVLHGFLNLF